ncbi:MAG: XRE family transcriptional regulator [Planctomycetota bacterium]
MSLGQIIRRKRLELRMTLDEVSRKAEFSKPYLSAIETGKAKNPPSDQLLGRLEIILDFKKGLLLRIAHMERLPADIREEYEIAEAENQRWRQIIKRIVHSRSETAEIALLFGGNDLNFEQSVSGFRAGRMVPIINKITTGYPMDFDDMEYLIAVADDYVRCPDLYDSSAFAVCVIGDSMQPRFNEGDIVILSPAVEVRSGDDCFVTFSMPHETTFRRVFFESCNSVRLQPRNEKYPPTIVEDCHIFGIYRAVAKFEKL